MSLISAEELVAGAEELLQLVLLARRELGLL
jgi:hypothetical protein